MAKPPFSTMPLPHDAPDWFKGHIWGNIQRGWQFENNAGALWANPITTINAFNRVTGGNGSLAQPFTGWDSNINWAAGSQIVQLSSVGGNAATYYAISAPIAITGQRTWIVGDGMAKSQILWTGGAGTAITFSNGAAEYNYGGVAALNFSASDTINTKTFISLIDCGHITLDNIGSTINGWTGNSNSVAVRIAGREFLTIDRCVFQADIPAQIEPNPNVASESFDHSSIRRSELVCNSQTVGACLNVITGSVLSNATFADLSMVNGQYGLRFADTTAAVSSYIVTLQNSRWEQSNLGAAAIGISIEMTGAAHIQGLAIRNVYLGGTAAATAAIKFRNVAWGIVDNVTYSRTGVYLDADNSNGPISFIGGFRQAASTVTLGTTFKYFTCAGNTVDTVSASGEMLELRGRFKSRQTTAPTTSAISAGIGTTGTVTLLTGSTDQAGAILLTFNGAAIAAGVNFLLTFNVAYSAAPAVVLSAAAGSINWTTPFNVYAAGTNPGNATIVILNGVAPVAGNTLQIHYHVIPYAV